MRIFNRITSRLRRFVIKRWDPRRISEEAGERVVFQHLKSTGFLDDFEGKRILEVGPKHGKDSLLLASLKPSDLVLLDLPEKQPMIERWFPQVPDNKTYIQGNILYLTAEQQAELGCFDLIWCLGVIYHNVEQLRLLKKLYDLCRPNGKVVIESAITRNKKLANLNVVEIHWPGTYRNVPTITHLPSRLAIKSWLEMCGFSHVNIHDVYSKKLASHRAVLTGIKQKSNPYVYYKATLNPVYWAGDAK